VLLERLAEYDAGLVVDELPLLGFLVLASLKGPERASLLHTIRSVVDSATAASTPLPTPLLHQLAWIVYPIITLASSDDEEAQEILKSLRALKVAERCLSHEGGRGAAPPELSVARGDNAIRICLRDSDASSFLSSVIARVERAGGAEKGKPPPELKWALFVALSLALHPSAVVRGRVVSLLTTILDTDELSGLRALPTVLYLLNVWAEPELRHRLLSVLPTIGKHELGRQLIQGILRRFRDPPPMSGPHAARARVVMGSACIRLGAQLYAANTRALKWLERLLVSDAVLSDGVDEFRLARCKTIGELTLDNPEAGLPFVGVVQDYLRDALPAVTALAVDCVTYLCTADCLDYLAAFRILGKPGRVSHLGHPLVMTNLADFYGAAAEIFDADPDPVVDPQEKAPPDNRKAAPSSHSALGQEGADEQDEEEDEEEDEPRPKLPPAYLTKLLEGLWGLSAHGHGTVRGRAYFALTGYVRAQLYSEELAVPERLRTRCFEALRHERDEAAREGLVDLVTETLQAECEDASTWKRALNLRGSTAGQAGKPSRKTVKSLPTAAERLSAYNLAKEAGAAGGALFALASDPGGAGVTSFRVVDPEERMQEVLLDVFVDVLSDEDGGGRCPIQRLVAPLGFLRFMATLLRVMTAALKAEDSFAASVAVVERVQAMLVGEMDNPGARSVGNCHMALAALAQTLPSQLSHKADEILACLLGVLDTAATSIAVDIPVLLASVALVGRSLDAAHGERVLQVMGRLVEVQGPLATRTDRDWCEWGTLIAVGALSDWVRQQHTPDLNAARIMSRACQACLGGLQGRLKHPALAGIMEDAFGPRMAQGGGSLDDGVMTWEELRLGWPAVTWEATDVLAVQGAILGLSALLPNLCHCGMARQVLQVFHLLRAAVAESVPGAEVGLATAAVVGLQAHVLQSGEVYEVFSALSSRLDGSDGAATPSESAVLGLVNLVVAVQGLLTLPAGVVEGVRTRLLGLAGAEETEHGLRIASLFAAYTLLANGGPTCSVLGRSLGAGIAPDRSTAAVVAAFVDTLRRLTESPSQRCRSAAYRILGMLVALRQVGYRGLVPFMILGRSRLTRVLCCAPQGDGGGDADETGGGRAGGAVSRIDESTFGLPLEGTLVHRVFQELIRLAVGGMDARELCSEEGIAFVRSSLGVLEECQTLRISHKQMTLLLQNFLPASKTDGLVRACVSFAVRGAARDSSYATWLYDVAVNAPIRVADVVSRTDS
jgi:hypothetical protein